MLYPLSYAGVRLWNRPYCTQFFLFCQCGTRKILKSPGIPLFRLLQLGEGGDIIINRVSRNAPVRCRPVRCGGVPVVPPYKKEIS